MLSGWVALEALAGRPRRNINLSAPSAHAGGLSVGLTTGGLLNTETVKYRLRFDIIDCNL